MYKSLVSEVEKIIQYRFKDEKLLLTALTHSSYANEAGESFENNERLEFLGDAVLELSISEELYKRYPEVREGGLTNLRSKLVSEPSLANLSRQIGLHKFVFLGKGEEAQGGRERDAVLCDALESVFGAVFLDGDFQSAKKVILNLFKGAWPENIQEPKSKDFKSSLQEITQKSFQDRPKYLLVNSYGPEHAKTYQVELLLPNQMKFRAEASSVKKAEQQAAQQAVEHLLSVEDIQD